MGFEVLTTVVIKRSVEHVTSIFRTEEKPSKKPAETSSKQRRLLDAGFLLGIFFKREVGEATCSSEASVESTEYTALYPRK
jgi:hypothetical protein